MRLAIDFNRLYGEFKVPLLVHVPSNKILAKHLDTLKRSGINPETAKVLGIKTSKSGDSIIIPVFDITGKVVVGLVTRYDDVAIKENRYPSPDKTRKYKHFGDTSFYYPHLPNLSWSKIAQDRKCPIYLAESYKQSIKLSQEGFPAIGVDGASSDLSKKDFSIIKWQDRQVYIVFDGDKVVNPNVKLGEDRLKQRLEKLGAKVTVIDIPVVDPSQSGIDDYLTAVELEGKSARAGFETLLYFAKFGQPKKAMTTAL